MSTPSATAAPAPAELPEHRSRFPSAFTVLLGVTIAVWLLASARSIVFDQAESRMHTIQAILVATLGTR